MTIDAQKLHNRSRDRNEDCLIVAMRVANPLLRVLSMKPLSPPTQSVTLDHDLPSPLVLASYCENIGMITLLYLLEIGKARSTIH